jgi:broad specificity phosphatase PhoE
LVTLIRHGQAGSRLVYDDLSETGRHQARALGRWFAARDVRFDAVVVGGLNRQQLTAQIMLDAMEESGVARPPLTIDPRWNEFDLDEVYAGIGPLLAAEDPQFGEEYEQLKLESADPVSAAHRAWRKCDVTVVRAWIAERFEFAGESFADLIARVVEGLAALPKSGHVAVVTSATPIGISIGHALDTSPTHIMRLAVGYNSAFSELDIRAEGIWVRSFNNVPHLEDVRLRTLR